jgi:hypothetical protein
MAWCWIVTNLDYFVGPVSAFSKDLFLASAIILDPGYLIRDWISTGSDRPDVREGTS